jgi:hypothetical protein
MTPDTNQTLLHKLNTHSATVAIIGLGYVGLPLAVALRSGRERPARHIRLRSVQASASTSTPAK